MKLIDKILGKHKTGDYYFSLYKSCSGLVLSLLVKVGAATYYDLRNNEYIDGHSQIIDKENLTSYVAIEKELISEREAKNLAKPYYNEYNRALDKKDLTHKFPRRVGMEL